jgi:23S rRNA (cytidine1920-2'-O)/16S rRNA (cytidine1409-2'-O)-methyltransferase
LQKKRLDILLVEKGFYDSREKSRRAVMAGEVLVNGALEDKPGTGFPDDANIEVRQNSNPYAGRGGLKLEKALEHFKIDLIGKTAIDIGASTGGFTDCMLQKGAAKVYAIDVGYGQIAWKLRQDSRVIVMERTNMRYVKPEDIGESAEFAAADVSFISLRLIFPVVKQLLSQTGEFICLVKPQFEAGRDKVGKHGVVRDPETHREVLLQVIESARSNDFIFRGVTFSPIKGPAGNIEYLIFISKGGEPVSNDSSAIENAVAEAHFNLD